MPQARPTLLAAILFNILILASAHGAAQKASATARTPVLVELFTSEGCSSCPPADSNLLKLDKLQPVPGAEIIVLEEHVDYWDNGGWHDRFSSHQFTDRQTGYTGRLRVSSGPYTPQMIVDGTRQFVGNDGAQTLQSITSAAQIPKSKLILTNLTVSGQRVSASVAAPPFAFKGDLYAALVDPFDQTEVKHGENGGHHLEHAGVVRTMQRIGSLKDLSVGPRAFSLDAPSDATPATMRLVVFAQHSDQGPIVAALSQPVAP
jgi:hypothetical protein